MKKKQKEERKQEAQEEGKEEEAIAEKKWLIAHSTTLSSHSTISPFPLDETTPPRGLARAPTKPSGNVKEHTQGGQKKKQRDGKVDK